MAAALPDRHGYFELHDRPKVTIRKCRALRFSVRYGAILPRVPNGWSWPILFARTSPASQAAFFGADQLEGGMAVVR
jgi:hypothetical protein